MNAGTDREREKVEVCFFFLHMSVMAIGFIACLG